MSASAGELRAQFWVVNPGFARGDSSNSNDQVEIQTHPLLNPRLLTIIHNRI
jgi:hypothetical protein